MKNGTMFGALLAVGLALVLAAPGSAAWAQAAPLDLQQAYQLARQHDRTWRLAQGRLQESQELRPQAMAQLLPAVTASVQQASVRQELTNGGIVSPEQRYTSNSAVVQLRQPLVRTALWRGLELAGARAEQARQTYLEEEQQLGARVVSTYFELLLAQDRLAVIQAQLSVVETRLAAARAALAAGQGVRNDVDDALAEFDRLRAQVIQADRLRDVALRRLELMTAAPVDRVRVLDLQAFNPRALPLPLLDEALNKAKSANARRLAQEQDLAAAQAALAQARSGHHPTMDLVGQVSNSTGENAFFATTQSRNATLGIQLTVPLYNGGLVNSQVRQASTRVELAREQLELTTNELSVQVAREHHAVTQAQALLEALRTALASADQAVMSSRKGMQAGTRSLLDALRAESDRSRVTLELAQARYDLLNAWVRLLALMGEITPARLDALNAMLAPL
jgi:TolC family type I secretion outer membrane protein